jgi:hypothetical protein
MSEGPVLIAKMPEIGRFVYWEALDILELIPPGKQYGMTNSTWHVTKKGPVYRLGKILLSGEYNG